MGDQEKRVKVKVNGKEGNFGTIRICLEKIREYLDAPDTDPELQKKKDKAKKAVDYLDAVLGVAVNDVEFLACAGNMWIE